MDIKTMPDNNWFYKKLCLSDKFKRKKKDFFWGKILHKTFWDYQTGVERKKKKSTLKIPHGIPFPISLLLIVAV